MRDAAPDLPALLKRWRARRSLSDVPDADPADGDGPVTQTVMAGQLGISEHHYRRLETGRRPMSSEFSELGMSQGVVSCAGTPERLARSCGESLRRR